MFTWPFFLLFRLMFKLNLFIYRVPHWYFRLEANAFLSLEASSRKSSYFPFENKQNFAKPSSEGALKKNEWYSFINLGCIVLEMNEEWPTCVVQNISTVIHWMHKYVLYLNTRNVSPMFIWAEHQILCLCKISQDPKNNIWNCFFLIGNDNSLH